MVSTASLLGTRHLWEVAENKPASSRVVSLGKALNGVPSPFIWKTGGSDISEMATPKRVRTSCPKYNDTICFLVNGGDKHGQNNTKKCSRTFEIFSFLAGDSLKDICCCGSHPSSSSGWRYETNGNPSSRRQINPMYPDFVDTLYKGEVCERNIL